MNKEKVKIQRQKITSLKKRLDSPTYKSRVSDVEYMETQDKYEKAKARLKMLTNMQENSLRSRQAQRASNKLEYKSRPRLTPIVGPDKLEEVQLIRERKATYKTEKMIDDDIREAERYIEQAKTENLPPSSHEILARNYQILLELRQEFQEERKEREQANAALEEQGLMSIQDKINFIGQQMTQNEILKETSQN